MTGPAFLLESPTTFLLFTGKGGVGKTSLACATAVALADQRRRVLLVSTDPASNLDEVLETQLGSEPTSVAEVPGLSALNIDPIAAARAYRERIVGAYRGILPQAAIASMEEQLSGACTVEIAAFNEFTKFLGEPKATADFDHILFDTAPTGHTLRLLDATESYHRDVSRTAPQIPEAVRSLLPRLRDGLLTRVILVTLPEATPVHEAARLEEDLARAGIRPFAWVINQSFSGNGFRDPILIARGRRELPYISEVLERHSERQALVPWQPDEPVGPERLRDLINSNQLVEGVDTHA